MTCRSEFSCVVDEPRIPATSQRGFACMDHRPYPPPTSPWIMQQTWHDLLFAHWSLPPDILRPLVPASLPVDTFDGQAWVGVVPFRMSGVRLRGTPVIPGLSAFPELNVRTYTVLDGRPGVYFLSLDAANALAVAAARTWYRLPYYTARMHCSWRTGAVVYESHRLRGDAAFRATYRPIGEVAQAPRGSLAHWLTERYCLYTEDRRGRVYRAEIHHDPWPLQPAEAAIAANTMTNPVGLRLPDMAPLLHFAERLDVVVWPLRRIRR